jgi:hypothetical protein
MALPARRDRVRSGIERAPPREWPRHRRFVRKHCCIIEGRNGHVCEGPIVFAHVRHETDGGGSLLPSDWWGNSMCNAAHCLQHQIGEPAFERRFGIVLKKQAMEFARASTDTAMKECMKAMGLL